MDTITAIIDTLVLMGEVIWPLKYWIGAVVIVMAVISYYAPALDYTANPAPARKDDIA